METNMDKRSYGKETDFIDEKNGLFYSITYTRNYQGLKEKAYVVEFRDNGNPSVRSESVFYDRTAAEEYINNHRAEYLNKKANAHE